jgi:predicted kinase
MVRRLEDRAQRHTDPSDANVAILLQQPQVTDLLDDGEQPNTLVIDTTDTKARQKALAAIQCRVAEAS